MMREESRALKTNGTNTPREPNCIISSKQAAASVASASARVLMEQQRQQGRADGEAAAASGPAEETVGPDCLVEGVPDEEGEEEEEESEEEEHEETIHRLAPDFATHINSPTRHVRTRIYYTSESHIHSLVNVLRFAHMHPLNNIPPGWVQGSAGKAGPHASTEQHPSRVGEGWCREVRATCPPLPG